MGGLLQLRSNGASLTALNFLDLPHADRFGYLLGERGVLVADGATGTNLFTAGLETGASPELWNIDRPEFVIANHEAMVAAGADIILTNSFGGTANRLKLHCATDRVIEVNRCASALARSVADKAGRPLLVAGSMGPTGEIMEPVGELGYREAVLAFGEQANALALGGADMIWIETMSAIEEAAAAIESTAGSGLPVICTMTFDTNGRTMMGTTPEEAMGFCVSCRQPLAAFGANCGNGFGELVAAIAAMDKVSGGQQILIAKANCGVPEYIDGEIRYSGTPETMQSYARLARDAGATIIGGCCGSTPSHIAALAEALKDYRPRHRPDLADIETALGLARVTPPATLVKRIRRSRRRT